MILVGFNRQTDWPHLTGSGRFIIVLSDRASCRMFTADNALGGG